MADPEHITPLEEHGLTQAQAAQLMGVPQPRISDLVRGRIERFSIDGLVNMLTATGRRVRISVEDPPGRAAWLAPLHHLSPRTMTSADPAMATSGEARLCFEPWTRRPAYTWTSSLP